MTWQERLHAQRERAPYREGELLRLTASDFAGRIARVGRVWSNGTITLQVRDGRDHAWTDFATEREDIVRRFTRRAHEIANVTGA